MDNLQAALAGFLRAPVAPYLKRLQLLTMRHKLTKWLRRYLITSQEQYILRVGKAILFTSQHLEPSLHAADERISILGYLPEDRFAIPDMRVVVDGVSLAWIQNIQVDIENNKVIVGHFAVDKNLTGIGLAKRLALAFGNHVKSRYGSTHIQFEEQKILTNPAYRIFFHKKLGATAVDPQQKDWLWTLP